MTEDEARAWTEQRFGSAAVDRLARFAACVLEENSRQNLISPTSAPHIWTRHIVDSLQLAALGGEELWLDIGTGGGFPGLAIAIVRSQPMMLVEPRRKRAEFLRQCAEAFGLRHVTVVAAKVENVICSAGIISARAVASVENLLHAAAHCSTFGTRWLLPRGAVNTAELASIAAKRSMMFHVEHSITQRESSIVVMSAR